jgi:O-methyltransferase
MSDRVKLSQGTFVTFTGSAFRLGHAKDPYRVHEVRSDMLHLVAAFAEATTPAAVLGRLRLSDHARQALSEFVCQLVSDGILEDAAQSLRGQPGGLKATQQELVTVTDHVADITGLYPQFVAAWQAVQPYTLTSIQLGFAWWNACQYVLTAGVPGAVVECGVWRGGSMMLAAQALVDAVEPPPLYLYDTFDNWSGELALDADGFVTATGQPVGESVAKSENDSVAVQGAADTGVSEQRVRARVVNLGYPADRVITVVGRVQETLPAAAPEQIALLRLDTDFYDSTRHELEHLYPRLMPGGVLLVDDYGRIDGATRAVDEYFAENGPTMLLNRIDVQGRIGVKPG